MAGNSSGLILSYYPRIRSTTKILNEDSPSPGLKIGLRTSRIRGKSVKPSTTTFGDSVSNLLFLNPKCSYDKDSEVGECHYLNPSDSKFANATFPHHSNGY